MQQINGVVFDWSGTLSNDAQVLYEAVMRIFDRLEHPHISFREFKRELVIPYMEFYHKYLPGLKKKIEIAGSQKISKKWVSQFHLEE